MTDAQSFYTDRIPSQFNRAFEEQHTLASAADAPPEASQLFEAMLGVDTTICIEVKGAEGSPFYLNIESGRMEGGTAAQQPVLLTLVQDAKAFEVLARASGDSALGFLGGLAGLAGELQLTASRVGALREIEGCFGFELKGDDGFSVLTHFGTGPRPPEAQATIRVESKAYEKLQSGELNPMEAFMNGAIDIEGDMQKAMQLALALVGGD